MDQRQQSAAASPRDVAAVIEQHAGAPRPVPEHPARLTTVPSPAPAVPEPRLGIAAGDPARVNPTVTDDVDDILLALGDPGAGEPHAGVTVYVQHQRAQAQRDLMSQVLSWPSAYVVFPGSTSFDAVARVRFRHRPQLQVVFRAFAVAAVDARGGWVLDGVRSR